MRRLALRFMIAGAAGIAGAWLVLAMPRGLAVPATVRIPIVKAHPPGAPSAAALFSHLEHDRMRCYSCHPSVFPQARKGFTHEEMRQGRYCGACHDGQRASPIAAHKCDACHVP